jgi:cobalt-zinc-cadmium efflux system membrane fusion protein
MHFPHRVALLICALSLAACSRSPQPPQTHAAAGEQSEKSVQTEKVTKATKDDDDKEKPNKDSGEAGEGHEKGEAGESKKDAVTLSDQQVASAGIETMPVRRSFTGAIDAPGTIVANAKRAQVVAVAVGGRIIALNRNLGEAVARGDALAVIESQDAAQLKADLAIARRELELANTNFQREEHLYQEKVSAQQDYIAARTAAQEAKIRADLAQQRLVAAGGGAGDSMNQLTLRAPIKGYVVARKAALGDAVQPNSELFEIADLSEVSVDLAFSPDDAGRVTVGSTVDVSSGARTSAGRIAFLSRIVDPATRQVHAIATLANGNGAWRIGETVHVSVPLSDAKQASTLAIPRAAVQTVEDKPSVFVRVKGGFAVKHVVLGPANGAYVAVLSGLSGDERIAVSNSYVLKAELGKGEAGGDDD